MTPLYLGVDMAAAKFDAALWREGQVQPLGVFTNDPAGYAACQQAVPAEAARVWLIVEPSGGYEQGLLSFALDQGWTISLPNPRRVRTWIKGQGRRAKTDRLDAAYLAAFGAQCQPKPWQPLPPAVQQLDSLLRRRTDLEASHRQELNRQASAQRQAGVAPAVLASYARLLAAIEAALAELEAAIAALVDQAPALQAQVRLLQSVPGVGPKTVLPLLVLLTRWQVLTEGQGPAKGLVAFVGLDPQTAESGTSLHTPSMISRMGDKDARRWLYLCALGGKRGHNPLRLFFERLVGRGKPKKLALVACMRKVLIWAWAVFRQQLPFDPSRAVRRTPKPIASPVPA
jgi:transposase